jgi:hypothetical protein
MTADSVEHVISYWMLFEKFQSPPLGGFAVLAHWLPFLLFSMYCARARCFLSPMPVRVNFVARAPQRRHYAFPAPAAMPGAVN